jgi:hypothetical protein
VPLVLLTVTVALPDTVPTAAVTVIAVPAAAVPTDREVVAVPVAPVVAEMGVMVPAEVENVTVAPLTGLLFASVATAVMVEDAEPSDGMVALLAETVTAATVEVPVVVVPVPENAWSLLPPQPVNPIARASKTIVEANFRMYHPKLMTVRPMPAPVSRR